MKKRMHLRYRKKKSKKIYLFFIIIIIIFFFAIKKYMDVKPLIINFSEMEANKLATLIINTAIIESNLEEDSNFYEIKTNEYEVLSVNFDTKKVNKELAKLTLKIQNIFGAIESGNIDGIGANILGKYNYQNLKKGVILYVPLGYLTGSPFLANVGPKIPLKITLIGDVRTDIKTELKDYGLNNALLKIYIYVEVVTQAILPTISNVESTIVEYPVVLKIIQGKVPSYYLNNNS